MVTEAQCPRGAICVTGQTNAVSLDEALCEHKWATTERQRQRANEPVFQAAPPSVPPSPPSVSPAGNCSQALLALLHSAGNRRGYRRCATQPESSTNSIACMSLWLCNETKVPVRRAGKHVSGKKRNFRIGHQKKTCGNAMERSFPWSIGLGHMADTSSKGSSDESTRDANDQPADASERAFIAGHLPRPPSSLLSISIQFPFSPKDALSGEPASFLRS